MCVCLEVDPPQTWVLLHFFKFLHPNDLLQIDPTSGDEPETVCESCYETKNTSIFAWYSIPSVGHYRWLHDPICRLPFNNEVDFLIHTIQRILDFLKL